MNKVKYMDICSYGIIQLIICYCICMIVIMLFSGDIIYELNQSARDILCKLHNHDCISDIR